MTRQTLPAIDGWFTTGDDGAPPHLVGHRCAGCGTHAFPFRPLSCPNPGCRSTDFDPVPLSRTGRIWSYTDARYQPPPPYIPADPYEPFCLAAVELAAEQLVVLGQVAEGYGIGDLEVGQEVELVVEPLYTEPAGDGSAGDVTRVVWRWKPVGRQPGEAAR